MNTSSIIILPHVTLASLRILMLLLLMLWQSKGDAQCSLTMGAPIPDDNGIVFGFSVSGLVDGNLASPTQGICGVELMFNHEFIGDLTIILVSPNEDTVYLVGAASGACCNTGLSTWDIDFVPCGSPNMPDGGFDGIWSNNQLWQALAPYDGTYHPNMGCLEDFNTGPANGIWQLIVEDHDPNQLGNLLGYTLVFCDPTGLSCEPCAPNAGTITPASIARCEGIGISTSELTVDYGSNGPPTDEYEYQFLLVQGNVILQYGAFFSATPPPGNYTICGLSYHEDDSILVNAILESGDFIPLFQTITDGDICGELTPACVSLRVDSPPDTVYVESELCSGEVFTYRGQNYFSVGVYIQTGVGPTACDSIFEIRIAPRTLVVDIPEPDTLGCGGGDVVLTANVSGAMGPFTFLWTTDFGNITSPPNLQSITVNQAGPYIVSITDGLCTGTAFTNVQADQAFPQIFVDGGTITCTDPVVLLEPIFVPTDGMITWTGAGGFSSNQSNVSVTIPGTYFIEVTNQQGCSTTRPVDVDIDTTTSTPVINIAGANCQASFKVLGVNVAGSIIAYAWSGPNGFTSNSSSVNATDPGLYMVQVTFSNGCIRAASFNFDGDFAIPNLNVPANDTLNCNEVISLTANSTTPGVIFQWSGPNGFGSNQAMVSIDQAGAYQVNVIAPNGCSVQQGVTIVEGNDLFDFDIFTDTITCINDTVPIQVLSNAADQFNWINYSGPDQGMPIIHVTTPGTYEVQMTDDASGCVITGSIVVPADLLVPSFGYTTDTITCAAPIASLEIVPFGGFPLVNVYWELPDFTIVQGTTLMSGLVGEHRLFGVGPNGCIGIWHIQIPRDTLPPFLLVESDTISCQDTVHISSQSLDSVSMYVWSGPGILVDDGTSIDVNLPGVYTLQATGENGCVSVYKVNVDSNYILPQFDVVYDSIRCDQPATLTATSADPSIQFVWFNSSGQVLSVDTFLQTNIPGQYIVQAQGLNKCPASDTITLLPPPNPILAITANDTITCVMPMVTISSTTDVTPAEQYWINAIGDTISTNAALQVTDTGPYIFAVTGSNGCTTRDTVLVPIDTIAPNAVIELIGEIRCQERDVIFSGLQSTPSSLLYDWSTVGGNFTSDNTLPVINAQDTGRYYLSVTNVINGCEDIDSFHLVSNPEDITGVVLHNIRPVCTGEQNGAIEISTVVGGIGPFLYQLPPGPPQVSGFFDGVGAGMHLLVVTDVAGCEFDTLIEMPITPAFTVSAGEDIEIYLGETATLIGSSDLIATEIQSTMWDSLGVSLCQPCLETEVAPWETTNYTFTMQSVTGCVRSDEVTVFVIEEARFYLPNVFSPNGDGINDEMRIFATEGMTRVLRWIIFDRWGNTVFGRTDFDPFDNSIFWDGVTTTGETANPAVFAYLLEIQLINGNRKLLHGDITLIR